MDLHVFPTSRSIRAYYSDALNTNQLLPHAITINEFEQKSLIYPNKSYIDAHIRPFLLHECAQFSAFNKLHFSTELFSFLDNSTYVLRLFDELSLEGVSFDALSDADTYAEYQEHISILHQVYTCYQKKLNKLGLIDKSNILDDYTLNHSFFSMYDVIYIHLEGILSSFETTLFFEIAKHIPLFIYFNHNPYHKKMHHIFEEHGFDMDTYGNYLLDISHQTQVFQENTQQGLHLSNTALSNRLLQLGFIKQKIYEMLQEGLKAQEIVVLLPDESFAKIMREFDTERNYNYAMGIDFDETLLYRDMQYVYDYLSEPDAINKRKIFRVEVDALALEIEKYTFESMLEFFKARKYKRDELKILNKAYYQFKEVLGYAKAFSLKDKLALFLKVLKKASIDDVGGGKITVMGVLESRAISYRGVVVVDFNEGVVPKLSVKDMFLSSGVREHAGLPTFSDRMGLQKYYYTQLFSKAEKVYVSYVENDTMQKSRFLDELAHTTQTTDEKHLHRIIFGEHTQHKQYQKEIIQTYDFTKVTLSASRLQTYLLCKRKYYYQYISKYGEVSTFNTRLDAKNIGNILHTALMHINHHMDKTQIAQTLQNHLATHSRDVLDNFELDVWMKRLEHIASLEETRFNNGYEIVHKEKKFQTTLEGFLFEGRIDRIDKKDGKFVVIDYKSGKIKAPPKDLEKLTDFQLTLYKRMAGALGDVEDAYYYELRSGKMIALSRAQEQEEMLKEKLQALKNPTQNFALCEDVKTCQYCPYVKLCGREDV